MQTPAFRGAPLRSARKEPRIHAALRAHASAAKRPPLLQMPVSVDVQLMQRAHVAAPSHPNPPMLDLRPVPTVPGPRLPIVRGPLLSNPPFSAAALRPGEMSATLQQHAFSMNRNSALPASSDR